MSRASSDLLWHAGWGHVKQFAGALIAAGLIYGGTHQIFAVLKEPIASGIIYVINSIIRKAFRNAMPLPEHGGIPWLFHVKVAAVGVIVVMVGLLVGLWVNAKGQRERPSQGN